MSTRSVIGYETQDGKFVGVYCHYDGYTSNMLPQLESMSWEEVSREVNKALYEFGGARSLEDFRFECFQEPPRPETWGYFEWPPAQSQEYNYRKRLDETVEVQTSSY